MLKVEVPRAFEWEGLYESLDLRDVILTDALFPKRLVNTFLDLRLVFLEGLLVFGSESLLLGLEILELLLLLQIGFEGFFRRAIVLDVGQGRVVLVVSADIPDAALQRLQVDALNV